ncbi:sugar-binding transcriptional regulator [Paenibacillus cymbidii]|uniref:sugar-binding transcriptional regulator n=1 Tax=Paenibacillus cymbidii TaxID=1639034 RepID=UPI001081EDE7|nr:sugar-binding domain-containing protein [Paenibacillus cymbidii]
MRSILDIQKKLLPDLTETLKTRYTILHHVLVSRVVGRRTLASSLDMTERVLRGEVEFLKEQGLLESDSAGMRITDAGSELIERMAPIVHELFGLSELEARIRERFGVPQVIVVPGDSDSSPYTKRELGRAAAGVLRGVASKDDVIAVTGGSTLAAVADHLTPSAQLKGNWFVPARGGLGESVELQANTIASTMAKKTGGHYRLLHVPDHLGEEAFQSLIQDPNIREIVDVIRSARIVLHGIGEAMVMARRRKSDPAMLDSLRKDGALAEAFGYYFDKTGVVVHKMSTLGLRLEDIQRIETVIAVAGGRSKGESIGAVLRFGEEDVLVTDEAAAGEMLRQHESP